jgi:small ubiquitin-related modifier
MAENGEEGAAPASESITIRVKEGSGDEMFFKVKKQTKMEKIFNAYAQRRGIAAASFRFMLDGHRIKPEDTPKMLELEENDQIDVMLETVGG